MITDIEVQKDVKYTAKISDDAMYYLRSSIRDYGEACSQHALSNGLTALNESAGNFGEGLVLRVEHLVEAAFNEGLERGRNQRD